MAGNETGADHHQPAGGRWRTPGRLAVARSPADAQKAIVVLVHGYAEHVGRYEHVIAALCGAGYTVVGMDDRGHGHSGGRRVAVRRFDSFVDDLDLLIDTKVHGTARSSSWGTPWVG